MPKIRNKWGEDRILPGHGVVEKDGIVEVTDEEVEGLVVQPGWEAEDHATEKVAEKAARARKAAAKKADQ